MMPAEIQNLAPELLNHILSYLFETDRIDGIRPSITDLLSVSRTSKRLRLHALPFIYRDIQLSDRSFPLRKQLLLLLRTLLNQPGLLEHIRTVSFEILGSNFNQGDLDWIHGGELFTSNDDTHESNILASFLRGIGLEPNSAIWPHFLLFGMLSLCIDGIIIPITRGPRRLSSSQIVWCQWL
jgi:hypothetical protein